jgi:hypothetical protein
MGMEIMKAKLVEQRLFDDLVREQERFDPDRLQQPAEASRQMPVDENGLPVFAVARNIRDIVGTGDLAHPPPQRFRHVQEDEIVNVFGFVAQFSLQVHRDAPEGTTKKCPAGRGIARCLVRQLLPAD